MRKFFKGRKFHAVYLLIPIVFMLAIIHIGESVNHTDDVEEVDEDPFETEIYIEDVEYESLEEPEIEEEEIFVPAYSYTEEDLDLLARLIYSESCGESYVVKLMVGSVVMNRLDDPNFPDTLEEVIYQKNQFSVTTTKINGVVMIDRPADEESIKAAYDVLNYGSLLPEKVQVFYADSVTNNWVNTREPYGTFDNTVFAYIYPKGE